MIVVVEGPTAVGKTTWCRRYYPERALWETPAPVAAPDHREHPEEAARFWQAANAARWQSALTREEEWGVVVCDTDPFKLHYAWCLWQVGELNEEAWSWERDLAREQFRAGKLGLADLVVVGIASPGKLRERREADIARQRRRFDLHVRLTEPLTRWYQAVERLDPHRVIWGLPDGGLPEDAQALDRREPRSGEEIFHVLMHQLDRPAVPKPEH